MYVRNRMMVTERRSLRGMRRFCKTHAADAERLARFGHLGEDGRIPCVCDEGIHSQVAIRAKTVPFGCEASSIEAAALHTVLRKEGLGFGGAPGRRSG